MSAHEHSREDAAAYALGALDPAEAEEFRRHMNECVLCREDVAAFQDAVTALPASAPQYRAPKQLRRRVMDAVREEAASKAPRRRMFPVALGHGGPALGHRGPARGLRPAAIMTAAATALAALVAVLVLSLSGGSSSPRSVRHLPSPPPGRIYELWVRHGDRPPVPTNTLFTVNRHGTADIGVPGGIHGVSAVLVSAEPAGGSEAPTTTPVIVTQLS
jgi:anti-sigma factor RsiW